MDLNQLNDLPGAELILPGLEDLKSGKTDSIGALLITIASPRLTEAGLKFPTDHFVAEPEFKLYDLLQEEQEDAYGYYNALLRRLVSFCDAIEHL